MKTKRVPMFLASFRGVPGKMTIVASWLGGALEGGDGVGFCFVLFVFLRIKCSELNCRRSYLE